MTHTEFSYKKKNLYQNEFFLNDAGRLSQANIE